MFEHGIFSDTCRMAIKILGPSEKGKKEKYFKVLNGNLLSSDEDHPIKHLSELISLVRSTLNQ